MKSFLRIFIPFSLFVALLCVSAYAEGGSVSTLMETALSQLDYEEAADGYTKYGPRYGYPTGHWCDMFVCWCAEESGISDTVFPISVNCTRHVRLFTDLERYHKSAALGGDYVPVQGDLIFFYDYLSFPKGEQLRHVGLVLCVENGQVFTVEGNTLTNRLDADYYRVNALRRYKYEPDDYVAVKCYALNDRRIHGYASPDYEDRTPLANDGFVDLGKYEELRGIFTSLAEQGIMPETSAYTFSPRYGMTRGDFLKTVMKLFAFPTDIDSEPFSDVPEGSECYEAVMTARAMGLLGSSGDSRFYPDAYVSGDDAQAILSRALAYAGAEDRTFAFSEGDFSYLLTPYTIRADLAQAFYSVQAALTAQQRTLPVPEPIS